MLCIKVVHQGKVFFHSLEKDALLVGSSDECNVKLSGVPDKLVSIRAKGDDVHFLSRSSHGIVHNGERQASGSLEVSDTLTWKDLTIVLVRQEGNQPAATRIARDPASGEQTVLTDRIVTPEARDVTKQDPVPKRDHQTSRVHTRVEREIRKPGKSTEKDADSAERTRSMRKTLENLGVVKKELADRAVEMASEQALLSTAEILVHIGVLTEHDIDVKPTKQLVATGPQLEGKVLGDYLLEKEIGSGGFGVVYRATGLVDGEEYAVKVLYREYSEDITQIALFARESKTARQFEHDNILKVHGLERFRDTYYMVSEFVNGGDLKEMIRSSGTIPPSQVASLGARIARALHYAAHPPGTLRGIIHRDIKPQNILLTTEGVPKIADFGLAKFEEGSAETQVYETTDAMVFKGTVSYAAPERFKSREEIDHRSDLYSVGVMLYEMATGKLPFEGDDISKLILAHMSEKPVPPRILNPSIPSALENIILRCLRKKPEQRYENGEELAQALEHVQQSVASSGTFSLGAALQTMKFAGSVTIPDKLPDGLPWKLRLKYSLLRKRPMLYRGLGVGAVALVLLLLALVFVPRMLEYKNLSDANAHISNYEYAQAIEILQGVTQSNPDNKRAAGMLEEAKERLMRLQEQLLPRIERENASPDPDLETLFSISAEAFDLDPTNKRVIESLVTSAIGVAKQRLDRGEFKSADELFAALTERLKKAPQDIREEYLNTVEDAHRKAEPLEKMRVFRENREHARRLISEMKNMPPIVNRSVPNASVNVKRMEIMYSKLEALTGVHEKMVKLAPGDFQTIIAAENLERLSENIQKCLELEQAGAMSHLQKLLLLLRVERELKSADLEPLLALLAHYKAQTPFDNILSAARRFADPTDPDRMSLALQLCQIVLNIEPSEERALQLLDEIAQQSVINFKSSPSSAVALTTAQSALLAYAPYSPKASGYALNLIRELESRLEKQSGFMAVREYWPALSALHDRFARTEAFEDVPSKADYFEKFLIGPTIALFESGDAEDALRYCGYMLSRPVEPHGKLPLSKKFSNALLMRFEAEPVQAHGLCKALQKLIRNNNTLPSRAASQEPGLYSKLEGYFEKYIESFAVIRSSEPSRQAIENSLAALVQLQEDGFDSARLLEEISFARSVLADYDKYVQAIELREKLFEHIARAEASQATDVIQRYFAVCSPEKKAPLALVAEVLNGVANATEKEREGDEEEALRLYEYGLQRLLRSISKTRTSRRRGRPL
ncbi:MAG: serine/threonine-protein kinase [Planctomycetota bacterium]|nr:serine/threonine-protein kinase [Planctomycetota bacterium]